MRFFRRGWGGGSVKTERGRGEIFKMKLKMAKGGYKRLQGVTGGDQGLQRVSKNYTNF